MARQDDSAEGRGARRAAGALQDAVVAQLAHGTRVLRHTAVEMIRDHVHAVVVVQT